MEKDFNKSYEDEISHFKDLLDETIGIVKKHNFPKDINDTSGNDESREIFEFSKENFNENKLDKFVKNKKYVYIIFCKNDVNASQLDAEFSKVKSGRNDLKLPLNNYKKGELFDANKVLYVGSSKDLKTRLKQHFTNDSEGTYALHLSEWYPDLECRVFVFDLTEDLAESDYKMLLIEDALSSIYKPLLGKRGPNTK